MGFEFSHRSSHGHFGEMLVDLWSLNDGCKVEIRAQRPEDRGALLAAVQRGSTDPMCSGMTMRWLAHVSACTWMSDATLRAKQPHFPASMSASDLDEFHLLQRLLRVTMTR